MALEDESGFEIIDNQIYKINFETCSGDKYYQIQTGHRLK